MKSVQDKGDGVLSTKQKFVIETYELLAEKGYENLRVRDIANRVGCTAAALYKHFDSVDHLVMLASVRFLDAYAEELMAITRYSPDPLTLDLQAWRCFINHAFENPPIYTRLFWENVTGFSLGDIMAEYTLLFDRSFDRTNDIVYGYYYTAMFEDSMQKRDYIWLRKAAGEGLMTLEDALYVSKINDCIAHASLASHLHDYKQPDIRAAAIEECRSLIERNIEEHRIRH